MDSVCEFKEHCAIPQLKVESPLRDTGPMVPGAVAITHCIVLSPGNTEPELLQRNARRE